MGALDKLAKLGQKALQAQKVGEIWHKAQCSPRVASKLRKEFLASGR